MKSKWLIKNNHKKLIIFFNGWGLDENIVSHLKADNYDVLMFYDYEDLEIPKDLLEEIQCYSEKNIIAWSFGVWACSEVVDVFASLSSMIALNGTPLPVDNNFGIPEKIFDLTLSGLSEKTYPKFFQKMFIDFENKFNEGLSNRDIKNKKQELGQIKKQALRQKNQEKNQCFNKIFVGMQDKIFPLKNQLKYWEVIGLRKNIIKFDSGHCLFNLFDSWDKIVEYE